MTEPLDPEQREFFARLAKERSKAVADYFEALGKAKMPGHVTRIDLQAILQFDDGTHAQVEMIWPLTAEEAADEHERRADPI